MISPGGPWASREDVHVVPRSRVAGVTGGLVNGMTRCVLRPVRRGLPPVEVVLRTTRLSRCARRVPSRLHVALTALVLVASAACFTETDPAAAARADSSAAGYAVGEPARGSERSGRGGGAGSSAADSSRRAAADPARTGASSAAGGRTGGVGAGRSERAGGRTAAGRDTTRAAVSTAEQSAARDTSAERATAGARDTAAGRLAAGAGDRATQRRAKTPGELPSVAAESARTADTALAPKRVVAGEFLEYDPGLRTAYLRLVAGYNGHNGGQNINGASRGSDTVRVPLGWRVVARFVNRDSELQHSAIVVPEPETIPLDMPPPAFPGAASTDLEEGVVEGLSSTFEFVASREGRYIIADGVPGQAQGGTWIVLVVSDSVTAPVYR